MRGLPELAQRLFETEPDIKPLSRVVWSLAAIRRQVLSFGVSAASYMADYVTVALAPFQVGYRNAPRSLQ
jgi:hypothetical protein